jgi:hypothetical protein
MTLESVMNRYVKHIFRIKQKANAMKRILSHGERKAVAHYFAAAQAVQNLIDAPTPAWVGAEFDKEKTHRL